MTLDASDDAGDPFAAAPVGFTRRCYSRGAPGAATPVSACARAGASVPVPPFDCGDTIYSSQAPFTSSPSTSSGKRSGRSARLPQSQSQPGRRLAAATQTAPASCSAGSNRLTARGLTVCSSARYTPHNSNRPGAAPIRPSRRLSGSSSTQMPSIRHEPCSTRHAGGPLMKSHPRSPRQTVRT